MEVVTVGLVLALVWKCVDVAKMVLGGDRNGAVTQVVTWVVAIGVAWLASAADLTEQLHLVGDRPLGDLNAWSIVLAGLLIGSGASTAVDFKQAFDGSDSAGKPPLTSLPRAAPRRV